MITYILRRLLIALPVLLIAMTLTFLLMRTTPGNPFTGERALPESALQVLEKKYYLDGSLSSQVLRYLGAVSRGDLRESIKYRNRTVQEILAQMLPVSILLGLVAFVLAFILGVGLGAYAAMHQYQRSDRLAMLAALLGLSVPNFIIAPMLILIFAIHLRWLPVAGWGSCDQIFLPALCLALPFAASLARLTRSSLLEVLHQDFVRTARAKGLNERQIFYRHTLKVALLPVVSYCGPMAAGVLTGSIVIEQIFLVPGLGPFFVNSVLNRDLYLVCGTVLIYSSFLIFFNLVVDVLYHFLDPRIKLS